MLRLAARVPCLRAPVTSTLGVTLQVFRAPHSTARPDQKTMKPAQLATLAAAAAFATSAQATWSGEVTSLRTVEIGTEAASLPECPKRKHKFLSHVEYIPTYDDAYPNEAKDKLCWKSTTDKPLIPSAQSLIIANVPFIKGAGREVNRTGFRGGLLA